MSKRSVLKVGPADVPLTLAEAKGQLKLEPNFTDDDALITTIVDGVTSQAQNYVQRQFMQATWQLYLDSWADLDNPALISMNPKDLTGNYLALPYNPVASVTSVKYQDTNNATQTLDPSLYQIDILSAPARIRFIGTLPALFATVNAVVIEYVAGYGGAGATTSQQQAAVPTKYKMWIKMHLGTFYQNRQTVISGRMEDISQYSLNLLQDRIFL